MNDRALDAIEGVMQAVIAGWKAGDGNAMAKPFAKRARFVTFDGRLLVGPEAIAATHQQAFDTHLKGTVLRLRIDEIRSLGDGVWAVFTTGGIGKADGSAVELVGDSMQTFVCIEEGDGVVVEAFQNTRERPITDGTSAAVWREFDERWETRNG